MASLIEPAPTVRHYRDEDRQMITTLTILSPDQGNIYVPPGGREPEQQGELLSAAVVEPRHRLKVRNIVRTFLDLLRQLVDASSPRHL
jgi:hypothetical protein